MKFILTLVAVFAALSIPFHTHADAGHSHGDEIPTSVGGVFPRFAMGSELFEVVGILKGKAIEIYLDHYQTNEPLENAALELELNGNKTPVQLHASGAFHAVLPQVLIEAHSESPISVAMKVFAGDQVQVLAGELTLPHGEDHQSVNETHSSRFDFALYGAVGLLLLVLVVFGVRWGKKHKLTRGAR